MNTVRHRWRSPPRVKGQTTRRLTSSCEPPQLSLLFHSLLLFFRVNASITRTAQLAHALAPAYLTLVSSLWERSGCRTFWDVASKLLGMVKGLVGAVPRWLSDAIWTGRADLNTK